MTEALDSELEARFRASMPGAPDGACPSAEVLWSAAGGELPPSELAALSTHLASCGVCGEALSLSAELAAVGKPRTASSPRLLALWRRTPLGVAAVGIPALAAGLVLALWWRSAPPVESPRGPLVVASRGGSADHGAIRSLSAKEQPASEVRLEWTPVERAVRYRVQVSSDDLQPLYDKTVEQGTSLRLPPAVEEHASGRPAVAGGDGASRVGVLHWQVDAILPDGRIVTSPAFTVWLVTSPGTGR
jgi:hypothetical protein